MGQEDALARTHEGEPGLPRGRSGLPIETVRAAQRERLLRAVIAAVASDRVHRPHGGRHRARRPRVEGGVLRPLRGQGGLLPGRYPRGRPADDQPGRRGGPAGPAGAGAEEALRAGIAAFLDFLAREPAFARAFYVDMPAAGPRAVARIEAALHNFARLNRAWHERARRNHPAWPAVPYQAYYALAGATAELVRAQVSQDKIGTCRIWKTRWSPCTWPSSPPGPWMHQDLLAQ